MVDLPGYYDEEKFKDLEIKIADGKVSKADFEKLEKRHKELEKGGNDDRQDSPKMEESNDGAAAAGDGSAIEVDGADGNGPRTAENEDPDWVKKYDAALTRYGQENGNEWTRDNEADENGERPAGLKGKFKTVPRFIMPTRTNCRSKRRKAKSPMLIILRKLSLWPKKTDRISSSVRP